MNQFRVVKPFYLFNYNAKNQSHKAHRYDEGIMISEATRNRITPANRDYYTDDGN